MNTNKEKFIQCLLKISQGDGSAEDLFNQFSQRFLQYASETPDNLACVEQLTLFDMPTSGLSLHSGELISDILNTAEGSDIPEQVKAAYPNLTQAQWDATLRISTVILTLFDRPA